MKVLRKVFLYLGIFFIPVGIIYGFMTNFFDGWAGFSRAPRDSAYVLLHGFLPHVY